MSEALKNTSQREKILVAVLSAVLIVFGYFFFRGAVLDREILVMQEQIDRTQRKVDKATERAQNPVKLPEYNGQQISKRDISKLKKTIEKEEKSLAGSGHQFVDLNDVSALPQLQAEITRTAEKNGLLVISKRPHQGDLVQMTRSKTIQARKTKSAPQAPAGELKRPLYDMYLSGNFHALQRFLVQIGQLEFSVVLTRMRVNTTDRTSLSGNRMLDIEMTLAL
jgi:Tfp pilus assembly protein PilO